jgi:hypothetical protein
MFPRDARSLPTFRSRGIGQQRVGGDERQSWNQSGRGTGTGDRVGSNGRLSLPVSTMSQWWISSTPWRTEAHALARQPGSASSTASRCIAFVPAVEAPKAIEILRGFATTTQAVVIGDVRKDPGAEVVCCGLLCTARTIDMLSGEQLPRIC